VYEKGGIDGSRKSEVGSQQIVAHLRQGFDAARNGTIDGKAVEAERGRDFKLNEFDRFRYRTRYFADSGIIGSKDYVNRIYQEFKHYSSSKHEKIPKTIKGLDGVYSLKRLSDPQITQIRAD